MARCTVMGCATYNGLPINELNSLKQFLFSKLVKYWNVPYDFEPVWSRCVDSIGHGCTRARKFTLTCYVYLSVSYSPVWTN